MHRGEKLARSLRYLSFNLDQNERMQRTIESELRTALRENELMLYYQPQLSLQSGGSSKAPRHYCAGATCAGSLFRPM